jgi:HSP90 family molecular chaperone
LRTNNHLFKKVVDGNKQLIISDNGIGFDMDKVKIKLATSKNSIIILTAKVLGSI